MDPLAVKILPYESQGPMCEPFDAQAPAAAAVVVQYLRAALPGVSVEHIGSTAVPGCDGKGILDLMAVYPDGELEKVRDCVDNLGFQRQTSRESFPEERPMRTGAIDYGGRRYSIHLHVIAASNAEVEDLRYFRDCLRADPELRKAYIAYKKRILTSGISDSTEYAHAKGEFIRQCLGR
jgi:GrpB-like predicted nucleotidyltransferase (UPF0157 family)